MKHGLYQRIAVYATVALGGLTMVLPFVWMLSTSLKTTAQSMAFPPEWIPNPFVWENYTRITDYMPFFLFLYNSVKIAFFVVFGTLLTCSLAGYAFAKLRFPGRKPLFLLLLSTMMIPTQVTLIPVFVIMKYLGWINTHYALIVPAFLAACSARFCCASFFSAFPTNWKTLRALTAARRGASTGASCCRWLSPRSLRWPSSLLWGRGTTLCGRLFT